MNRQLVPLLILFFTGLNLLSCDGLDENYSTNPNHRLMFSVDTLSFDTVFTTIGSATRSLMIYNKNSQPLLIEDILLSNNEKTGFRINVDGRKGDHFKDVRIRANDSLYVFVEITVDPNRADQPLLVEDSILFMTNGVTQSVRLEAYGQDVVLYKGGETFQQNTRLTAGRPYLIYDSLIIEKGVQVEIDPGALFYMHDKANIINYGTIKAIGTLEKPIVFRGDRLDFILNDVLPYDRTPAQWGGFFFRPESFDNRIEHVIIRNGTTGLTFEASSTQAQKARIADSQITNMEQNLLYAANCHIEVANTELSNAGGGIVILLGGKYRFTHCTIANYITLKKRKSVCLTLSNNLNREAFPLEAIFENSIIDGSFDAGSQTAKGELLLAVTDEAPFQYQFDHCVIKTAEQNGTAFNNVLFAKTALSYRLKGGEKNKYRFDFRPDSMTTLGVGKADPAISINYPFDRYGIPRLIGNTPDIGAYEYVEKGHNDENP